ncbi:MAG: glycoside hydrolase family 31 protein [Rhodocyclaceae bacterium]
MNRRDTAGTLQPGSPRFALTQRAPSRVMLTSSDGHVAHVFVLTEWLLRVMVLPQGHPRTTRTWSIAPGRTDVPFEGIDKFDLSAFDDTPFTAHEDDDHLLIETSRVRLYIERVGLRCTWHLFTDQGWQRVAQDRPTQAYNFGQWGEEACHYLVRTPEERYFGLGEKTGDMDRAGQRYRMSNVDSAGYCARHSDPLYKHIPFYITHHATQGTAFGLFYDTCADCTFDLGREISHYHGPYRYFMADAGDLDYYFIAGPSIAEVVARFTWLTGVPMFPPRWSLGYSGATVAYTDAPDAQARMGQFLDLCRTHDIPCRSFHLSSGYTGVGDRCHVFHWNDDKFPDARRLVADYREAGVRLIANVKPALLTDHPYYDDARIGGLFVRNATGDALTVPFWGGQASYVDFTQARAVLWWQQHVRAQLLDYGIAGTWNDNNEFEITDGEARAHGGDHDVAAMHVKPLLTLLMLKASVGAQRQAAPHLRAFAVSRAGVAGMQRYVQTWSGNNVTSWETLKYNIKMGLGLALSGVSNCGHDVGGFHGPAPDAELFVRWLQFGIFMPRFAIHSENGGSAATEPWMYPAHTPTVRALIGLREQLLPYLYDLAWRAHTRYAPMVRPTFHDFPHDALCFAESDDMMIGGALLHAAVTTAGVRARPVYLPAGTYWFDFFTGARYGGGTWHVVAAPLERPLLFAREGAIIAINRATPRFGTQEDSRGFVVFPPLAGQTSTQVFEDDGESEAWRDGACGQWHIAIEARRDRVQVAIRFEGDARFHQQTITLELPAHETRAMSVTTHTVMGDERCGDRRVLHLTQHAEADAAGTAAF